jgi:hypothetical protein
MTWALAPVSIIGRERNAGLGSSGLPSRHNAVLVFATVQCLPVASSY